MRKTFNSYFCFGFIISSLLMAGCSPISGDSLLTDAASESTDYAVDTTPLASELSMALSGTTIYSATTKAEVTGECNISSFPYHSIQAYSGSLSGAQLSIVDLLKGTSGSSGACVKGRFDLAVATSTVSTGSRIWLVLTATNADGASYTSETSFLIYK